jgi:hypothetical protein
MNAGYRLETQQRIVSRNLLRTEEKASLIRLRVD